MITAGIDVGSKNIKVVLLEEGKIVGKALTTGGFNQREAALELLEKALDDAGLNRSELAHLAATGMGRDAIDFADSRVTDITAAARAAAHFFPGAVTIVEVGAEESRGIMTDGKGKVLDSAVNDKCAAGSGSFTESMARALGVTLPEFAEISLLSTAAIPMNAQCTVFAESEVVSLIHNNTEKKEIARAVHDAMARRVGTLARRVRVEGEIVLLGGLALNAGFVKSLAENLGVERMNIPEDPELADALGAALVAAERAQKEASRG